MPFPTQNCSCRVLLTAPGREGAARLFCGHGDSSEGDTGWAGGEMKGEAELLLSLRFVVEQAEDDGSDFLL